MKWLIAVLVILLLILQYQLWLGSGSYFHAWSMHRTLTEQQQQNQQLQQRNQALEAQVAGLKQGDQAMEELARNQLGMVKQGETFYQVVGNSNKTVPDDMNATQKAQK